MPDVPEHLEPSRELPSSREELLQMHAEARRRRDAAPLGSPAYVEGIHAVAEIEIHLARIEREMDPPKV